MKINVQVSTTPTGAQLVEMTPEVSGGRYHCMLGKDERQTAWVMSEDGKTIETRLYGAFVTPPMIAPAAGLSESDALARLDAHIRAALIQPRVILVVVRAGDQRGYVAMAHPVWETYAGIVPSAVFLPAAVHAPV